MRYRLSFRRRRAYSRRSLVAKLTIGSILKASQHKSRSNPSPQPNVSVFQKFKSIDTIKRSIDYTLPNALIAPYEESWFLLSLFPPTGVHANLIAPAGNGHLRSLNKVADYFAGRGSR